MESKGKGEDSGEPPIHISGYAANYAAIDLYTAKRHRAGVIMLEFFSAHFVNDVYYINTSAKFFYH